MNVIYVLGDGIVSVRQGMYFKTRLDLHPCTIVHDSQTISWMDLGKLLRLSRQSWEKSLLVYRGTTGVEKKWGSIISNLLVHL